MSVDPRIQAALDAPLRDTPNIVEPQFHFALDRAIEHGWPRPTLFGTALTFWSQRRRDETERAA